MAFAKLRPVYHKMFRGVYYLELIRKMDTLRRDPTHRKIMKTVKRLREDDDLEKDEAH